MRRTLLYIALGIGIAAGRAEAAQVAFSAGSLIIPMDLCYQPTVGTGGWSAATGGHLPGGLPSTYCPDPVGTAGNGLLRAYGLAYTMMQNNIPVYYITDPAKTSIGGVDMTVTNNSGTPVSRVNHSTGVGAEFMTSTHTVIQLRGAPFVINVPDVPAALAILHTDAVSTAPQFTGVSVLLSKTNFNAQVRGALIGPPPLIALNGLDATNVTILEGYLNDAGINTVSCTHGSCSPTISYWPTVGNAFTVIGNSGAYSQFTTSDALNAGGFKVFWSPHWAGASTVGNSQANLDAVMTKIAAFADAGNAVFAECVGMTTIEGGASAAGTSNAPTQTAVTHGHFLTNSTGTTNGFVTNYLATSGGNATWPQNSGDTWITPIAEVTNPIVQIGDYIFSSVSGYTEDFIPVAGVSYVAGIHRLLYTSKATADPTAWDNKDILVTGSKDGNASKGQVVYLAGHSYAGTTAAERIPLNTLLHLGQVNIVSEQSRSAPIVLPDGRTFIGSYIQQSQAAAAFPPWSGHFREYAAGALSGTTVTAFSLPQTDWDAATHIATQGAADSRSIFTAVNVNGQLTQTAFTTANATALGIVAATITSIRKGGLGGIDHSVPSIVFPSTIAGSSTRPTVAYIGALDGMLHAILVSGSAPGKVPGDELWAFIPPSQLAHTAAQAGGVDGSPQVNDVFLRMAGGVNRWRTVLAIPDASYGGTVDALDITDPLNPTFLWEASDTATVSGHTYVMGRAQAATISSMFDGQRPRHAVFVATDNTQGTAGNGFNLYALDVNDGSVIWRMNHLYSNDTTHNDVPGSAAAIDTSGKGQNADKVFFADLEGKIWAVPAGSGPSAGMTPIYDAALANNQNNSVNFPIESGLALYRDPSSADLMVAGVTGGADWVPSATLSYAFKVDTKTLASANLYTLSTGERAYAPPTVSGNQAYLITSYGNIQSSLGGLFNAAGNLIRVNLGATAGATTLATITQGAGAVEVDTHGNLTVVSGNGVTQNANSGRDTSQAVIAINNAQTAFQTRAWLDFN